MGLFAQCQRYVHSASYGATYHWVVTNTEEAHHHILGVQCNVWTEFIATPAHVQYMLLPRMLAISEVQWSNPEDKDYERFKADVISHQMPVLKSLGYTYCKVIED